MFSFKKFFRFNGFNGGYYGFGGYDKGQNMHQMKGKGVFSGMSHIMPFNFAGAPNATSISDEVIICLICSKSKHSAYVCWYRFNEDFVLVPPRTYNKGKYPKIVLYDPYIPPYMPSFDEYSVGISLAYMPRFHSSYSPRVAYMANFERFADKG